MEFPQARSIEKIIDSVRTLEGGGFMVRRPFPTQTLNFYDPFLLLDEMGPMDVDPGEAKGAPDHPHRGFETVTYLLSGSMEHKDSQGHAGKLTPGDVQWMTAGSGVIHSEMPTTEMLTKGGRMHGFQLWVNLPSTHKMMNPRYQEIPSSNIPLGKSADELACVYVIAGEALGAKAIINTITPISYLHFIIKPGGSVSQKIPANHNAFVYVFSGDGLFGEEKKLGVEGEMIIFKPDGENIIFSVPPENHEEMQVLLLAGQPLNEPVLRYGPFVMNTKEEILEAVSDYQNGKMGVIPA